MNKNEELIKYKNQISIIDEKYQIANKWLYIMNNDKNLTQCLLQKGIQQIVIYGASELALRLIEYCRKERFKIIAIVDKKIKHSGSYMGIRLVSISDLEKLDLTSTYVVITALGFYDEIKNDLSQRNITNVISLRDLIEWSI